MGINFKKIWTGLGLVPKPTSTSDSLGEVEVLSSDNKARFHNGTSASPIVTEAHSATLTNKTINADDNTISDLETDNLKAGVLNIDLEAGPATNTELPSALAVQTLVDTVETDLTNHINDTTDAHDASSISVVPTGNLAADDVQEGLQELQGDIDSLNDDVADLITLSGVAANATDLGTFTGTTIPDNSDIKEALQSLETAVEAGNSTAVDDLVTLSGVAINSTDLGTFTGTTIPDNSDIKEALQALETAVELGGGGGDPLNVIIDEFTGDGTEDTFTLTVDPDFDDLVFVFIDGVYQLQNAYSITGDQLTFTSIPNNGSKIEARILEGGGGGDVEGPASSADNKLVTFNGTTGKIIKDATNISVSGNTITTTNTGGSLTIDPDGTGSLILGTDRTVVRTNRIRGGALTIENETDSIINTLAITTVGGTSNFSGLPSSFLGRWRGTWDARLPLESGDIMGSFRFVGGFDSTTSSGIASEIRSQTTETWNITNRGASLSFFTTPNGTITRVERMRIDQNGNVNIGNAAPNASARLQVDSTVAGFLPPRMTTAQRDAIASPATGLTIYNTSTNALNNYNGTSWVAVGSGGGGGDFDANLINGRVVPLWDWSAPSAFATDTNGSTIGVTNQFSPSGRFMAHTFTVSPYVHIYEITGDRFSKLPNPAILPAGGGQSVSWSRDERFLIIGHSTSPFITIYERSGTTFTKLANPATLPTGTVVGGNFSNDGRFFTAAHSSSPYVTIYERKGTTFTKLANPSVLPTGDGRDVSWSADDRFMAVAHFVSPYVTIYEKSGTTFTKLANPAALPSGNANGISFHPSTNFLTVSHTNSPYITNYQRSGTTFTKLADPTSLLPGIGFHSDWNGKGDHFVVGHNSSPYFSVYSFSSNTLTKLANPSTLPIGESVASYGARFSLDGKFIAVSHRTGNTITIYKTGSAAPTVSGAPNILFRIGETANW